MKTILIADDEKHARQRLVRLISDIDGYEIHTEAVNGKEAIEAIVANKPDIVLLDIKMPVIDGIQVAKYIQNESYQPAIIFTTAYDAHAIEAFNVNAIGYLLKPIKQEALKKSLDMAARLVQSDISSIENLSQESGHKFFQINHGKNIELIDKKKIYYFLAEDKYLVVGLCEDEKITEGTLKGIEQALHGECLRVHRKAIVIKQHIKGLRLNKEGYFVIMNNGKSIPVSRRKIKMIKEHIESLDIYKE